MEYISYATLAFLFSITSAKWAMDLGLGQFSQLLHGAAGFFLGPLVLLILYIRLVGYKAS